MKLIYSKANRYLRKKIKEFLEGVEIEVDENKISVPQFDIPYNKGGRIEETMTTREMIIEMSKDLKSVKTDVSQLKTDVSQMRNTPTMKQELSKIKKQKNDK